MNGAMLRLILGYGLLYIGLQYGREHNPEVRQLVNTIERTAHNAGNFLTSWTR